MWNIAKYAGVFFCLASLSACVEELCEGSGNTGLAAGDEAVVRLALNGIHTDGGSQISYDFSSRASSQPVNEGQAANLKNMLLLFADPQGMIVKAEKIDDAVTEFPDDYMDFTVPGSVKKVYALGNYVGKTDELTQFANAVLGGTPKKVSDFLALQIPLSALQDVADVTLFGADTDGLTTLEGSTEDHKLLQASVTLAPIVSRLEVKAIGCDNLSESWFESVLLNYLGIVKYYTKVAVDGRVTDTSDGNFVWLTDVNAPESGAGAASAAEGTYKYRWGDEATDELYRWSWDAVTKDGQPVTLTTTQPKVDFSTGLFAYNFTPMENPAQGSDLTLKLQVTPKWKSAYDPDPQLTTVTANFTSQSGFKNTPGQVYKVDFTFSGENITSWDPKDLLRVRITVTVESWKVVKVYEPVLN